MAKPTKKIKIKSKKEIQDSPKTESVKLSSKEEIKQEKLRKDKVKEEKKTPKVSGKISIKVDEKKVDEKSAKKEKSAKVSKEPIEREVKYLYPDNMEDSMTRKKFRHDSRAKKQKLENDLSKIKDTKSKDYIAKEKELKAFLKATFKS